MTDPKHNPENLPQGEPQGDGPAIEAAIVPATQPGPVTLVNSPMPQTDSAQARVDSVARTLDAAYQRASTLTLTPEESAQLLADFGDGDICRGAGGDDRLLYIEHASVRRRLMQVFTPGQWALVNRRTWLDDAQGFMYADCVLLVRGVYVGEAIGAQKWTAKNARMNYSDAAEGAQSEALRRIAGKYLGVGLQVWNKAFCEAWKQRHTSGGRQRAEAEREGESSLSSPAPPPPSKPTTATICGLVKDIRDRESKTKKSATGAAMMFYEIEIEGHGTVTATSKQVAIDAEACKLDGKPCKIELTIHTNGFREATKATEG